MANRVLRPDSGNDLLLQNNGGGSSIEIPNSGDIVITGTIGSGTIGSGVVFPAGHIIQSTWAGTSASISTASESPVAIDALECSITARQTNGKFLCTFIGGKVDDDVASGKVAAYLYKSENGGAYGRVDDPAVSTFEAATFTGHYANPIAFCYQYNATITAGQNIKFKPYYESSNDATLTYINHVGFISLTVQEIQL